MVYVLAEPFNPQLCVEYQIKALNPIKNKSQLPKSSGEIWGGGIVFKSKQKFPTCNLSTGISLEVYKLGKHDYIF